MLYYVDNFRNAMEHYLDFAMSLTSNLQAEAAIANETAQTYITKDNDRLSKALDDLNFAFESTERALNENEECLSLKETHDEAQYNIRILEEENAQLEESNTKLVDKNAELMEKNAQKKDQIAHQINEKQKELLKDMKTQ